MMYCFLRNQSYKQQHYRLSQLFPKNQSQKAQSSTSTTVLTQTPTPTTPIIKEIDWVIVSSETQKVKNQDLF